MHSKFSAYLLIILAGATPWLTGCDKPGNAELSASATAEASSDGSVLTRKPTPQELAGLNADIAKRDAVNRQYPGSETPWGASSERVTGVSVPGILKLQNGREVRLDGIRCDEKAVGYLRRLLMNETTTVAVLPSVESQSEPVPAEVWSVDKALQVKGLTTTPSYSNITETAITSGWCRVEPTTTCKHNERYAALSAAFAAATSAR